MAVVNRSAVRVIGFAKGDRKLDREPDFRTARVGNRSATSKTRQNFAGIASFREGQRDQRLRNRGSFIKGGRTCFHIHIADYHRPAWRCYCLLYTSDAADDLLC